MFKLQKAFTLIELLVAVVVLGVVLAIGLPNFFGQMSNNRSLSLSADMVTALNFARGEAIKRAARVSICPSTTGTTCGGTGDWGKGWIAFVDTATSDSATAPTLGTVLKYWNDLNEKSVITVKAGSTDVGFIRFVSSGALGSSVTTGRVINAYVDKCKGLNQGEIKVGVAGMVSSRKIACP